MYSSDAPVATMPLRKSRKTSLLGAVLAICSLCLAFFACLPISGSCFDATFVSVSLSSSSRRQILFLVSAVTSQLPAPMVAYADEQDDKETKVRLALYEGKATALRAACEWYRLFVGDLITTGGSASAGAGNSECDNGLCPSSNALRDVRKMLTQGNTKGNGMTPLSQVELTMFTPMSTMAAMAVWDPDASDIAEGQATDFQLAVRRLTGSITKDPTNGAQALELYTKSLEKLNMFLSTANVAIGAKNTEDRFLPSLPLTQSDMEADEYWQYRREVYLAASNPEKQFREKNAFGSKELRQGLKRFPGAGLLLR